MALDQQGADHYEPCPSECRRNEQYLTQRIRHDTDCCIARQVANSALAMKITFLAPGGAVLTSVGTRLGVALRWRGHRAGLVTA